MEDRRAGDLCKRHLDDGLSSQNPGPTEKGEKSGVALFPNLNGFTPACDGREHACDVGVAVFSFRTSELRRARKSAPGMYSMAR
jgi:hypothetical protein